MWVRLGIMTTVSAPILVFTKYKTIIPTPIIEEDLLAGGTEDCGCPRLDGYKVHTIIPAPH